MQRMVLTNLKIIGKVRCFKLILRSLNKILSKFSSSLQTIKAYNKPTNAIFEMSNNCNLNCLLCNTGGMREYYKHVQRGYMSFETFKIGLDKLLPELESVLLYNWGEPFLNKGLFKCIEYSYTQRVKTQLSTNMMLYTEGIGENLIQSRLMKLIVSCDGINQETYGKYRRGGDISRVIKGVESLIELKKRLKSKQPFIEMQCIVFKFNENEMNTYEKFWKSIGVDTVNFIRMSFMSKLGKDITQKLDYIPNNEKYQPFHPYGNVKKCFDLYKHITIDWNGDWYTCCFPSGEREYKVGNIVTDNFWEVWNGKKYQYNRRLIKKQKSEGQYCETMCHDCTGIFPREETKRYWA